ncbi:uncharacterized protein [Pseudochaenichthys georgianus]|uniref:uncharacterized protein n=1 Tax=Pseudochaenichthys georgianus TaxID=52239 RepID=UPI0039C20FDF
MPTAYAVRQAVGDSVAGGRSLTGGGSDLQSPSDRPALMGMAPEREHLESWGLSQDVIRTIQGARAASTRASYTAKWAAFQRWCVGRSLDPIMCPLPHVLSFLQLLLDRNLAFSTIKVYAAAISSCHVGFGAGTVFSHPLTKRFLQGVRRLRPVSRALAPQWDLALVLRALSKAPFEPLEQVPLNMLSAKVVLLLALTSAKRVSDLSALSVAPSCLRIQGDGSLAALRPNPAFMPKVITSSFRSTVITLDGFFPPPHKSEEEATSHLLCPVRALACYVARTAAVRRSQRLFVHYRERSIGQPLSTQRLSHWLCEAVSQAYVSSGVEPPENIKAHSTRGISSSTALSGGMSVEDICMAASWSSPCSFIQFYLREVSLSSLTHPSSKDSECLGSFPLTDLYLSLQKAVPQSVEKGPVLRSEAAGHSVLWVLLP